MACLVPRRTRKPLIVDWFGVKNNWNRIKRKTAEKPWVVLEVNSLGSSNPESPAIAVDLESVAAIGKTQARLAGLRMRACGCGWSEFLLLLLIVCF